ncbi:hypothetical protein AB6813_17320 [bacterium RCC_150]
MGHALDTFLKATDRLRFWFGPATQGDVEEPVVHKHDDFEKASEEELGHFVVETDDQGHHYGIRKEGT